MLSSEEKSHYWPDNALSPIDALLWLKEKITTQTPCSFIRLGDGEFRMMGYNSTAPWEHTSRSLKIWFGKDTFPEEQLSRFAEDLRSAVRHADLIGMPRLSRQMQSAFFDHVGHSWHTHQLGTGKQVFTDCSVHRLWQVLGGYWDLLFRLPFLGLITCRDIGQTVADTFQIASIRTYPVPSEKILPGSFEGQQAHFPDRFIELMETIEVPYQGAVFVVGAGGLGKVYCEHLRSLGGIAIDAGSVLDGWSACATRNFLKKDKHLYSMSRYLGMECVPLSSRISQYQEQIGQMYFHIPLNEKDLAYFRSTTHAA